MRTVKKYCIPVLILSLLISACTTMPIKTNVPERTPQKVILDTIIYTTANNEKTGIHYFKVYINYTNNHYGPITYLLLDVSADKTFVDAYKPIQKSFIDLNIFNAEKHERFFEPQTNADGNLTSFTVLNKYRSPDGTLSFGYDSTGQLTNRTYRTVSGSVAGSWNFTYDAQGRITSYDHRIANEEYEKYTITYAAQENPKLRAVTEYFLDFFIPSYKKVGTISSVTIESAGKTKTGLVIYNEKENRAEVTFDTSGGDKEEYFFIFDNNGIITEIKIYSPDAEYLYEYTVHNEHIVKGAVYKNKTQMYNFTAAYDQFGNTTNESVFYPNGFKFLEYQWTIIY